MSKKSKTRETSGTTHKVTASDVARHAGVSKWTVSRAFTEGASISPQAREKVLRVAAELGYRPNLLARGLTKRQTRIVGLVVDEMDNPNLLRLLQETSLQLQRRGYLSMLINISDDDRQGTTISLADQFQIDGLIFLGTVLTGELVNLAQQIHHIPLIVLYRNSDIPHIQVVSTDGYRAGREIAALLADQQYRRIGYMAGPLSESTQLRRLEGFRDGLAEHGLAVEEIVEAGHYQRDAGFSALSHYLSSRLANDRLEALFCENDILAIGALDALNERGETGSLGIVGFDDIDQAASPGYALTTYRQPLEQLVGEAVRRIGLEEAVPRRHLLPGELILRDSHRRR